MRYVLAALAAAILLGGRRDGREAAREVTLIRIHRQAECRKGLSGPWAPAAAGTRLTADDSLRTSNNSYADLQLDPPNRFRLNENALLKVERVFAEEKDAGGSLVRLTDLGILKGEVIARLDNLPARHEADVLHELDIVEHETRGMIEGARQLKLPHLSLVGNSNGKRTSA